MKTKSILSVMATSCALLPLMATPSYAMPNFARQTGMQCGGCHTVVPQLNRTGYEFRFAGYRLPDEIGKKAKKDDFEFANLFAARIQAQWQSLRTKKATTTSQNVSKDELQLKEVTIYPMTGSWGGNFGSLMELSMASGEGFEIENAFVRGVYGDANGWLSGRVGVMHPWEGFGASDRPLGNIRPIFQKANAKAGALGGTPGSTASPFYLWNLDETAAEIGYYYKPSGTTATARVGMGTIWKADAKNPGDQGDAAQGGSLTKSAIGYPGAHNPKDKSYQVVINQFINNESGASLYYYTSATPYPNPYSYDWQNTAADPTLSVFGKDHFHRFAAYANYYVVPQTVNLSAGALYGKDSISVNPATGTLFYGATNVTANRGGTSNGYYGEGDWHIIPHTLAVGYRYDYFNPNRSVAKFTQHAHTLSLSYHPVDYIEVLSDAQAKRAEQGVGKATKQDNQLLVNMIVIF